MVRTSPSEEAKVGRIRAPLFAAAGTLRPMPRLLLPFQRAVRRPAFLHPGAIGLGAVTLVAMVLVACSGPAATFDPNAPCRGDERAPGLYPDLEARIPTVFDGRAPDTLDSGRNCTSRSLGYLAQRGYRQVDFAGGTWETGGRSGVTIATFRAGGLQPREVFDFYKAGAFAAPKTDKTTESTITVDGTDLARLDTLNDESFQTVVIAAGRQPGLVRVVIVASAIRDVVTREAHETVVAAVVDAALAAG